MCGLVTVLSKKGRPAGQHAFQLYQKQASRGRQGYGYLAIHDNKLVGLHRSKDEAGIRSLLMKEKAEMIMFHHRLPTSTSNTVGTTHPMFVSHDELKYDYYFAHNGIVQNAWQLKPEHEKLGYVYRTQHSEVEIAEYLNGEKEYLSTEKVKFNDSESLAIEMARNIEGLSSKIDTRGPVAFWGIALEKGTDNVVKTFFGKNKGRDLCCITNKKWFCVTSESGYEIKDMVLNTVDMETANIEETDLIIDEAKPVEVPKSTVTPTSAVGFQERNTISENIDAYDSLEDKDHTYLEKINSGVPESEFLGVWVDGRLYYRPVKFIQQPTLPSGDDTKKALEKLEELATKYAKKTSKQNKLSEAYANGAIDSTYYNFESISVERDLNDLEEQMSALGLDQSEVETMLEIAMELEDYNSSYNTSIEY